jgi:hydroxymethylpyrimidine pyrophosphatase-like HAD family hydrolase
MTQRRHNPSPSHGREVRWLLVSDLDETLTGDDAALARFVKAVAATPALAVAINSSRPLASIEQTLASFPTAANSTGPWRPDATIGAMGSELCIAGQTLDGWAKRFTSWDRPRVDQALRALELQAHPDELQGPFKVSYTVPAALQPRAIEAVQATGVAHQIVISGQTNFDVLPEAAGKAAAIDYLLRHFAVDRADGLIVAGDSGNDQAMFELAGRGIVVANADDDLRRAVDPARAHFAKAQRAAGVLEGLLAWGVPVAVDTER